MNPHLMGNYFYIKLCRIFVQLGYLFISNLVIIGDFLKFYLDYFSFDLYKYYLINLNLLQFILIFTSYYFNQLTFNLKFILIVYVILFLIF